MNDVLVSGDYAFVACQSTSCGHGILVFDISDKTNPTRVKYAFGSCSGGITRIAFGPLENHLYGTHSLGVNSFDISVPGNTNQEDDLALWDSTIHIPGVCTYSGYLYINSNNTGLRTIDITDPTNLVEQAGHGFEITSFNDVTQHRFHCSAQYPLSGGAYDTCCLWGNWINDPCSEEHPLYSHLGTWFDYYGGNCVKVTASGVYLDDRTEVWFLTGSPSTAFTVGKIWGCTRGPGGNGRLESFDLDGGETDVHAHSSGQYPYTHNYQVLTGVNLMSSHVSITSGNQTLDFPKFQFLGEYVYILRKNGISICNADGAEIYDWTIASRGFTVSGNYIFICVYQAGNHRLEIYDITIKTAPVLIGTGTI